MRLPKPPPNRVIKEGEIPSKPKIRIKNYYQRGVLIIPFNTIISVDIDTNINDCNVILIDNNVMLVPFYTDFIEQYTKWLDAY